MQIGDPPFLRLRNRNLLGFQAIFPQMVYDSRSFRPGFFACCRSTVMRYLIAVLTLGLTACSSVSVDDYRDRRLLFHLSSSLRVH